MANSPRNLRRAGRVQTSRQERSWEQTVSVLTSSTSSEREALPSPKGLKQEGFPAWLSDSSRASLAVFGCLTHHAIPNNPKNVRTLPGIQGAREEEKETNCLRMQSSDQQRERKRWGEGERGWASPLGDPYLSTDSYSSINPLLRGDPAPSRPFWACQTDLTT